MSLRDPIIDDARFPSGAPFGTCFPTVRPARRCTAAAPRPVHPFGIVTRAGAGAGASVGAGVGSGAEASVGAGAGSDADADAGADTEANDGSGTRSA